MNIKYFLPILLSVILCSCNQDNKYEPEGLRKLSNEEIVNMAANYQTFDYQKVTYKREDGSDVPSDSVSIYFQDLDMAYDIYVNENTEPEIVVFRSRTQKDKELKQRIETIRRENAIEPIVPREINCDEIKNVLSEVYTLDQETRSNGKSGNRTTDRQNLETVISIIENCGMPTRVEVGQRGISAIWLVFQHADNYHRKKYWPQLKESADKGDIRKSQMALMQDRMLMNDGKPQIYGSQVVSDHESDGWKLYDLKEPKKVDKRRAAIGMEPLSDYLKNFDIEFTVKQVE